MNDNKDNMTLTIEIDIHDDENSIKKENNKRKRMNNFTKLDFT